MGKKQPHAPRHQARTLVSTSLISQSLAAPRFRLQAGMLTAAHTDLADIPPVDPPLHVFAAPAVPAFVPLQE